MRLRVFSDIHLDFDYRNWKNPNLWEPITLEEDKDTTLVIAGDIWTGQYFGRIAFWLNEQAEKFKNIIVVLGNHDYWGEYNKPYYELVNELKPQLSSNIYLLEKECITIDDIKFAGATLWTNLDNGNPLVINNAPYLTNDIPRINGMTANKWISEYNATMDFLIRADADVIITHYVPDPKFMHPRYTNDMANHMFNTTALQELHFAQVKLPKVWIFGHTHNSYNEEYCGIKFLCNPRGYTLESTGFDQLGVYNLEV